MERTRVKKGVPLPLVRALKKLGADIDSARRRRRIGVDLLAERVFITRETLRKVRKGDPTVSMAAYATVLHVLGFTDRLGDLADAAHDLVGRGLEEDRLPKRVREARRN